MHKDYVLPPLDKSGVAPFQVLGNPAQSLRQGLMQGSSSFSGLARVSRIEGFFLDEEVLDGKSGQGLVGQGRSCT